MVNENDEELAKRMNRRSGSYTGGVDSLSEYRKVSAVAQPLKLPHYITDTSPPKTTEECADEVMAYFFDSR